MRRSIGCWTSLVELLLPSHHLDKSREFLPLILITRNRPKYALTYREVISILMQRHVLVIGKVRPDKTYPAGFMDVISIPKTGENYRLLYDTKGRYRLQSIRDKDAKLELIKLSIIEEQRKRDAALQAAANVLMQCTCQSFAVAESQ